VWTIFSGENAAALLLLLLRSLLLVFSSLSAVWFR
jgi:hypothetical protein